MYKKNKNILSTSKILGFSILFSLLLAHIIGAKFGEECVTFILSFSLLSGPYLVSNRFLLKKNKILIMCFCIVIGSIYIFFNTEKNIYMIMFLLIWILFLILTIFDVFYFPEKDCERKRREGKL